MHRILFRNSIKLTQNLIKNLPLNPSKLKRYFTDKRCDKPLQAKSFATPHTPRDPPDGYNPTVFRHNAFKPLDILPLSVFRFFCGPDEELGPGASKCGEYKNPEYFAYHRYSFVDIQRATMELRKNQRDDGPLVCVAGCEERQQESSSSSDDASSSSSSSSSASSGASSDDSGNDECKQ